jgi:hypothetical protein
MKETTQSMDEMLEIVGGQLIDPDEHGFSRLIEFESDGKRHYIRWWKNLCYLSIGDRHGSQVIFNEVARNSTWPNFGECFAFKQDDEYVCMLAAKRLDWQTETKRGNL